MDDYLTPPPRPSKEQRNELKPSDKTPELTFRPVTEGLGFHPFSDGMPYAPVTRNQSPPSLPSSAPKLGPGTGAVSAGPPKMVRAQPIPRISVPIVKTPQSPAPSKNPTLPLQPLRVHQLDPQSKTPPTLTWVYLAKRVTAYLIDAMINSVLFFSALTWIIFKTDFATDILANKKFVLIAALAWVGFHSLFMILQEFIFKTSLGKKILKLSLPGSRFLLLLRSLLFIPSLTFFGIGLLWSLVDPHKRCWHDLLAGTQPRELY